MRKAADGRITLETASPSPALTRRSFANIIAGALAGSTFVAGGAVAARVAHGAPLVEEIPELLALGARVQPALDAYRESRARRADARTLFAQLCPPIPDELIAKRGDWSLYNECGEDERDLDGQVVQPPNGELPRRILRAKLLQIFILRCEMGRSTRRERHIRSLARLASRHEKAIAQALKQSGYADWSEAVCETSWELRDIAYACDGFEPRTPKGVAIMARVLLAAAEAEIVWGNMRGRAAQILGPGLARAVITVNSSPAEAA